MTDKDFYDRIDKARSLFTSREAVTRYCHDIRMLEDIPGIFFAILGRGPRAFQIGKISAVNH